MRLIRTASQPSARKSGGCVIFNNGSLSESRKSVAGCVRNRFIRCRAKALPTNLSPSFDLSAAPTPADGESDEIDVRPPGNDPLIVKAVNVRPGEVEVEADRL